MLPMLPPISTSTRPACSPEVTQQNEPSPSPLPTTYRSADAPPPANPYTCLCPVLYPRCIGHPSTSAEYYSLQKREVGFYRHPVHPLKHTPPHPMVPQSPGQPVAHIRARMNVTVQVFARPPNPTDSAMRVAARLSSPLLSRSSANAFCTFDADIVYEANTLSAYFRTIVRPVSRLPHTRVPHEVRHPSPAIPMLS